MKKLLTLSFLLTKLTALYCFSAMGLVAWDIVEAKKSPCHEDTEQVSQVAEHEKADCNACVIAADSWDQELVEASDVEFFEVVATIPAFLEANHIDHKTLTLDTYHQYYPPPQVLYKTAFHLPQQVTVLLS